MIYDGAHTQHQAGVENVLAGESTVDPRADRRDGPLTQQRDHFACLAQTLSQAAQDTGGFHRTLVLWRLETTTAAVRFTEVMLAERSEAD